MRKHLALAVWLVLAVFSWSSPLSAADHPEGDDAAPDAAHHEEGPPLWPKEDLALWSAVTFLLFVFVLKKFAWLPLISGLDARESSIRSNIEEAAAARAEASRMLAEHQEKLSAVQDEVREIIAEARRDAERVKQDIVNEAQSEAEATRIRAVADIERARDAALRDLFETLSGQVVVATEHVLGRALSQEDQGRLVDDALSQFAGASE